MTVTNADAIASLRPGVPFVIYGDALDSVEWHVDDVSAPTADEIAQERKRLQTVADERAAAEASARAAAIEHAKSLGFTDEMIGVMYPGLNSPAI